MTFYYHMYGTNIDALNIYCNNVKVYTRKGPQGNVWKKDSVTLNGNKNVSQHSISKYNKKLQFVMTSS